MSGNNFRPPSTKKFGESLRSAHEATPPTIPEEVEEKKKPSEGLFTVIAKQWIEQSSDDSDDNLPAGTYIADDSTCGRFCKSVDFRLLRQAQQEKPQGQQLRSSKTSSSLDQTKKTTTSQSVPPSPSATKPQMASSRFKIVPLESKYKRDRWQCHDYYDHRDPFVTRTTKPLVPPVVNVTPVADNRSARSMSDIQQLAPSTPPQTQKTAPAATKPHYPALKTPEQGKIQKPSTSRGTGGEKRTEILDGLEKSLSYTEPRRTKSVTVTPPQPSHSSAIDLKIDQAMELVKTHLMFAVREEVDGLRNKISELENTVLKLEKENTLLKRNVPEHILRRM